MQYYSMDTQNVKSGQNGQTDVQDDNRIIVKIRDLKENERYKVEGLFSGSSKYGSYFGLKLKDNKLAFIGEGTVAYGNRQKGLLYRVTNNNEYKDFNRSP